MKAILLLTLRVMLLIEMSLNSGTYNHQNKIVTNFYSQICVAAIIKRKNEAYLVHLKSSFISRLFYHSS